MKDRHVLRRALEWKMVTSFEGHLDGRCFFIEKGIWMEDGHVLRRAF